MADLLSSSPKFTQDWERVFDKVLTLYVKNRFLPERYSKKGPFNELDFKFFLPSVGELHDSFTTERSTLKKVGDYFSHPKSRSAYLLYFLPLQSAKFFTLFQIHEEAWAQAFKAKKVLRFFDLGSGPGSASLAMLFNALEKFPKEKSLPPMEITWVDHSMKILDDGLKFFEAWQESEPRLARVKIKKVISSWWKAADQVADGAELCLLGNVLNENSKVAPELIQRSLEKISLRKGTGAGTLFLEPALPQSARLLASIRNSLFESYPSDNAPPRPWGPCLHAGNCPLATGRDWCHFSVYSKVPGKWHQRFSRSISHGSLREWLKFCYLWMPSPETPPTAFDPSFRRVVSDRLSGQEVLICEPDRPRKIKTQIDEKIGRGSLYKIGR